MMHCPSRQEIELSLLGQLPDDRCEALFAHYEQCTACARQVAILEGEASTDWLTEALPRVNEAAESIRASRDLVERSRSLLPASQQRPPTGPDYLKDVHSIRDYDLVEMIGVGGMGRVYRARHQHLKRDVALKVLSPTRFGSEAAADRFRIEMQAVGQLDHPNIVRASDAGEHDGILYLVMDWVEGVDLGHVLFTNARLKPADVASIGQQAALGLAYAHQKGLVHRDMKPSNLLLTADGRIRILDFGLALIPRKHVEDTASRAGSLPYMAPEQFADPNSVGPPADVFGLGSTLFQLLTGVTVFSESEPDDMLWQRPDASQLALQDRLEQADIPPAWTPILRSMLSRDPRSTTDS